ncbi:MAG: D-aminoacyl-tRNA deacylase [Bacteroidota bacterium]
MIIVLQRVSEAAVTIEERVAGQISKGLLLLVGIEEEDSRDDVDWLSKKVAQMRIFADADDKMNLSVQDVQGQLLVISQFTLHASTKKGNRPSFIKAAKPDVAIPLYEAFIDALGDLIERPVETGEFGANMQVSLVNDGPVTIIIDSKNRQ